MSFSIRPLNKGPSPSDMAYDVLFCLQRKSFAIAQLGNMTGIISETGLATKNGKLFTAVQVHQIASAKATLSCKECFFHPSSVLSDGLMN